VTMVAAVERALGKAGLGNRREVVSDTFARLTVETEAQECRIDLAVDVRIRPVDRRPDVALLSLEELAADKVLALFGRAAARDFRDVAALRRHFSWTNLSSSRTRRTPVSVSSVSWRRSRPSIGSMPKISISLAPATSGCGPKSQHGQSRSANQDDAACRERRVPHLPRSCPLTDRADTILTPHQPERHGIRKQPNESHRRVSAGQGDNAKKDVTGWHAAGMVQVRVSSWTWGFKSPLAHHVVGRSSGPQTPESLERPRASAGASCASVTPSRHRAGCATACAGVSPGVRRCARTLAPVRARKKLGRGPTTSRIAVGGSRRTADRDPNDLDFWIGRACS
jgi:hypothetical protein